MTISKRCEYCGKIFRTKSMKKKYCSVKCRQNAYIEGRAKYAQICWKCKNACGGCSWSRNLIPVEGWIAEKVIRKTEQLDSYNIKYCPEFIHD